MSATESFDIGERVELLLDAEPVVVLRPERPAGVIDSLASVRLDLTGEADNLAAAMDCRLEWTLDAGLAAGGAAARGHPRGCRLKPTTVKGKQGFAVCEVGDGGAERPLTLSAFDVGVAGEGRLGYILTVGELAEERFVVSPETSNLRLALPARLRPVPGRPTVGQPVQLALDCARPLSDCAIEIRIAEEGAPPGSEALSLRWKSEEVGSGATKTWYVGTLEESLVPGVMPRLAYAAEGATHTFEAVLTVEVTPRAAEPGSPRRKLVAPPQKLATVKHPRLESMALSFDDTVLQLKGEVSGLDENLSLPMTASLYVLATKGGPGYATFGDSPVPFASYATAPEVWKDLRHVCGPDTVVAGAFNPQVPSASSSSLTLAQGSVEGRLVDVRPLGSALLDALQEHEVTVFATLGFPVAATSKELGARPVFARVADYGDAVGEMAPKPELVSPLRANMGHAATKVGAALHLTSSPDVFAPFTQGRFSWKTVATDVCSNLVSFDGKVARLVAPALGVGAEQAEEYRVFFATVAGESLGGSPAAWKGVASAILNRVGRYEWRKHTTIKAIVANTGFDAYKDRAKSEAYQHALAYLDGRPGIPPGDAMALRDLETAIRPLFLGAEALPTRAIIFYNPSRCGFPGDPSGAIDITSEVLGSPPNPRDARQYAFWRYKADAAAFDSRRQRWDRKA